MDFISSPLEFLQSEFPVLKAWIDFVTSLGALATLLATIAFGFYKVANPLLTRRIRRFREAESRRILKNLVQASKDIDKIPADTLSCVFYSKMIKLRIQVFMLARFIGIVVFAGGTIILLDLLGQETSIFSESLSNLTLLILLAFAGVWCVSTNREQEVLEAKARFNAIAPEAIKKLSSYFRDSEPPADIVKGISAMEAYLRKKGLEQHDASLR